MGGAGLLAGDVEWALLAPLFVAAAGAIPHVLDHLAAPPLVACLLQRDVHWSKVLTQRLTDKVKLAGSTIRWVVIGLGLVGRLGGWELGWIDFTGGGGMAGIPQSHTANTRAHPHPPRTACRSCEGANKGGVLTGEMRRNPHVQSYVVATDQVRG